MPIVRDVSALHPKVIPAAMKWIGLCREKFLDVLITETWRSRDVQIAYWAVGRESYEEVVRLYKAAGLVVPKPTEHGNNTSTITSVPPGFGWHPYGCAIDFVPLINGKADWVYNPEDPGDHWDEIADAAKKCGFLWGGNFRTFKDRPHIELHPGYTASKAAKAWADAHGGEWRIPFNVPVIKVV